MKTRVLAMSAVLLLSGCSNDPVTNYQWAQFANGLSAAAGQQQAQADADFYYRQQQLQQVQQAAALQNINHSLEVQRTGGWW